MTDFKHPKDGVVTIVSKDDGTNVTAQYNPKELQVDKNVPWNKPSQTNKSNGTGITLEYAGAEGRSLTLELLFDGYEQKTSVKPEVDKLNQLASVWQPGEKNEEKRRPHFCKLKWGKTLEDFMCVIEQLSVKYTMFSEAGDPLRATCTVKFKEADSVTGKKADATGGKGNA